MVVALAILGLVAVGILTTFLSTTSSTGSTRLKEVAVTLNDTALDQARATTPTFRRKWT
jgi:type II secretory pathway pseudopilin PulG